MGYNFKANLPITPLKTTIDSFDGKPATIVSKTYEPVYIDTYVRSSNSMGVAVDIAGHAKNKDFRHIEDIISK